MNVEAIVEALRRTGRSIVELLRDIPPGDARWKPPDGAWSILEVIRHLADEEVEDFRTRVRMTLEDPAQPWPPIDPPGWAVQRRYNDGDLDEAVCRFQRERATSVEWLRTLAGAPRPPEWDRAHQHPALGPLRAGDLLCAWRAHDCLHLRQIAKRLYQLAQRDAGAYNPDYAGAWTA